MLAINQVSFLINHVFLPPKLPQKNDSDDGFTHVFIESMLCALQDYQRLVIGRRSEIAVLIRMMENMRTVHDVANDDLLETELCQTLERVTERGALLKESQKIILTDSLQEVPFRSM